MKLNTNSEYIRTILKKTQENLNLYTDEKLQEFADNLALYKQRMEEFGGNKVFRYGNYIRELSRIAADIAICVKNNPSERGIYVIKYITDLVLNVSPWMSQGIFEGRNADLVTADTSTSLCLVIDVAGDLLGEEYTSNLKKALYTKGFIPAYKDWVSPTERRHALDTMGHNWWAVCTGGAGLALYHAKEYDPDYDLHMLQIKHSLDEWFLYPGNILQNKNPNWSENGDFIEYLPYMGYAISTITILDALCYRDSGERIFKDEYAKNIPEFILSMMYKNKSGDMTAFNFSDGYFDSNTYTYGYALIAIAARFKNKELLDVVCNNNKDEGRVLEAFFYPDFECETHNYDDIHIYNHAGVASMKFENMEFGAKTGESWNHNHKDSGTFIVVKNGAELISDSGSCPYSYPEYLGYFVTPLAHNVILKDGNGINEQKSYLGTKFRGTFPTSLSGDGFRYLLADATPPYTDIYERFYRHFLFIGEDIVIVDDLQSHTDGKLSMLLHSHGKFEINGNKIVVSNEGEQADIYPLYPENSTISVEKGHIKKADHPTDRDVEIIDHDYISINSHTKDLRQKFITHISDKYVPSITTGDGYEKIALKGDDDIWTIVVNNGADGRIMHHNAHLSVDDIKTDAFISYYCKDNNGKVTKYGIINGSYLKIDDKNMYSSILKVDCFCNSSKLYISATSKTDAYIGEKRIEITPDMKETEI